MYKHICIVLRKHKLYACVCVCICLYMFTCNGQYHQRKDKQDFSKERYNTHAKSWNSILYIKTNSATYIGSILDTMCCL